MTKAKRFNFASPMEKSYEQFILSNKVAFSDRSASRGIGAAIAKRLAQEGANVAITYVRVAGKSRSSNQ